MTDDTSEDTIDEAWQRAIRARVASIAPDADLMLGYAPIISYRLGGPDPLGYVITVRRDEPIPHWLYLTLGFSQPYDDKAPAAGDPGGPSGYGFEIALRVPRDVNETGDAPSDYVVVLQTLARYVFETGNVFRDGDYTGLEEPHPALASLCAFGFVADSELEDVATPSGTIAFRSAVGLDARELDAVKLWTTYGVVETAIAHGLLSKNYITVPDRPSFLDDPGFANAVTEGGKREGSRTGRLYFSELRVTSTPRFLRSPAFIIEMQRGDAMMSSSLLVNRIAFERAVSLYGPQAVVVFEPSERPSLGGDAAEVRIGLTPQDAFAISGAFAAGAKRYDFGSIPLSIVIGDS